jgi:hypothetical protein
MILHELTEAFEGAKISQKSGVSSPASTEPNSVYDKAHKKATKQSEITERRFDYRGNEVFDDSQTFRREYSVTRRGNSRIFYQNNYRTR